MDISWRNILNLGRWEVVHRATSEGLESLGFVLNTFKSALRCHTIESFKEWQKRNEIEWKLDISFLEKKKIKYKLDREPPARVKRKSGKVASAR